MSAEWIQILAAGMAGCGFAIMFHIKPKYLPLLLLGVLLIMLGIQFLSVGFIGNMYVDHNVRRDYNEHKILERSEDEQ